MSSFARKSVYVVAVFSVLSALLGFLRTLIFARKVGVGEALDSYYAAFYLPDLLFFTLAISVSSLMIIPKASKLPEQKISEFFASLAGVFAIVFSAIAVIAAVFAGEFIKIMFPGVYYGSYGSEAVLLARLLLLQGILLGLSNILSAFMQMRGVFGLLSLTTVFYNLFIILGTLFLYDKFGILGIGFGVLVGALVHALIPAIFFIKHNPKLYFPKLNFKEFFGIVWHSLPRSSGVISYRFAMIYVVSVASSFGAGILSVFNLINDLVAGVRNVFVHSHALVSFPTLSGQAAEGELQKFRQTFQNALFSSVFWVAYAAFFLVFFGDYVIELLFGLERGSFKFGIGYSFLVFVSASTIFYTIAILSARALYSLDKVKEIAIINIAEPVLLVLSLFALREYLDKFNVLLVIGFVILIYSILHSFASAFVAHYNLRVFTKFVLRKIGIYIMLAFLANVLTYLALQYTQVWAQFQTSVLNLILILMLSGTASFGLYLVFTYFVPDSETKKFLAYIKSLF